MSGIALQFSAQRGDFSLAAELSLPGHGVTVLFGHSGSGKTTLLRAMAGLERSRGRMQLGKAVWQDDAAGVFLPAERRPIGYVFQEASLFPHLSVRDNLGYGYRRLAPETRRISFDDAVQWLGLEKMLDRYPANLSGGERQRVAIGRALLVSPELLLMDEPLSALDQPSKSEIMPYLERLHRQLSIPVIYVTHSVEEVAQLADHIVQLQAGRVIAEGPAVELLSRLNRTPVVGEEPGAVIEAMVAGHDEAHQLTTLAIADGVRLLAPRLEAGLGEPVRVRIPAREVSISLSVPEGTSILNILPARIVDHAEGDPGRVLVQLELGGEPEGSAGGSAIRLLSRISRYSWERLGLTNGRSVQAQIKSMGLAR